MTGIVVGFVLRKYYDWVNRYQGLSFMKSEYFVRFVAFDIYTKNYIITFKSFINYATPTQIYHILITQLFDQILYGHPNMHNESMLKQIYFIYSLYQMHSPIPPTQFQPYPMTYSTGSPLANLNYNYAALYPPYNGSAFSQYPPSLYPASFPVSQGLSAPLHGSYVLPPQASYAQGAQGFLASSQAGLIAPSQGAQLSTSNAGNGTRSQKQLIQGIRDPSKNVPNFDINKTMLVGTAATGTVNSAEHYLNIQRGYSQIEYIPYESYYVDYEPRQFIQNIRVPVQKKIKDYYAVQHIVDYIPKEVQETIVDMVPQEKVTQKLYYIPVEKQVVHLPQEDKVHVHKPTTTTVISERPTVRVTQQAQTSQTVISRPVQQVQLQQNQFAQHQHFAPIPRSPSPQTQPIRSEQRPSPPKMQNVSQTISQPIPQPISQPIPQSVSQQILPPPPQTVNQPPRPVGQFVQNPQVLQANQLELQKKMSIPDNAKVNYQYSTRTERTLTAEEIAQRGLSPRIVSGQPSQQQIQRQFPQPVVNQPLSARPAQPTTQSSQSFGQPQGPSFGQTGSFGQSQPQSSLRPTQQSTDLMKNKQVDLADSQHIDITKSTFNKFYGTTAQPVQTFASGNQVTTSMEGVNKNSNAFSFSGEGNKTRQNQVNDQNVVNRNSDPTVNRISGGSVYDYDQNRADY